MEELQSIGNNDKLEDGIYVYTHIYTPGKKKLDEVFQGYHHYNSMFLKN